MLNSATERKLAGFRDLKTADLWSVLIMPVERRAIDQIRRVRAPKRGGGDLRGESVFLGESEAGFANVADARPTLAAEVSEQMRRLLKRLQDGVLVEIAKDKLAGFTNQEIAERQGTSLRSIERRLGLVRRIWHEEFA